MPRDKAKEIFEAAEKRLPELYRFPDTIVTVVNPFKLDHSKALAMEDDSAMPEKLIWIQFMKEDLAALLHCDAIFMLTNWVHSQGARIEHAIAKELGLTITYEQ